MLGKASIAMSKLIDLTGQKFGRLKVLKRVENDKWDKTCWLCECDCKNNDKNKTIIRSFNLRRNHTKSCGCLALGRAAIMGLNNKIHGHRRNGKTSKEYQSWAHMIQRCTNPNNKCWKDYGGRGIKVCKRWRSSFPNFLEDMGEAPLGFQLDRIKNNKGYCKDNCKWSTPKEQMRNTRRNHLKTYNGKTQCLTAWAEEYQINYRTLLGRINNGLSMKEALIIPMRKWRKEND